MKKRFFAGLVMLVMLVSGCSQENYVATVGNEKITQDEFNFYLENVKYQMQGTEISSEDDWQTVEIEGRKAIEIAKERALQTAIDNLAYIAIVDKLGIGLTEEDEANIDTVKEELVAQYGSDAQYQAFLKDAHVNDSFIDMLCRSMVCYEKLSQKVQAEQAITDNDMQAYFAENQEDLSGIYRKAKHILRLVIDPTTALPLAEDVVAEAERLAKELEERAKSGEDFDALVAEYSEDPGSKTYPQGYVFTDGEMDMDPAFQDGVDSLQPGEITLVKGVYGYHVIKRMPLVYEDVQDVVQNMMISERVSEQVEVWKTELDIAIDKNEEVLNTLN